MKRRSISGTADLLAVIGLALLAILALVLPIPDTVRAVVVVPFVLVLPGYALAAVIFPPGELDAGTRIVLVVIFSMAVLALGGMIVQAAVPLGTVAYAVLLALATIGCSAGAMRRRALGSFPPFELSRPQLPGYASIAGLLVAILIAAAAIGIATAGQHRQLERERFTTLWILPRGSGEDFSARIGVASHEPTRLRFHLRASQGGRALRRWNLTLAPGDEWQATLPASAIIGSGPVVATLLHGGRVYRRVALNVGAEL
jgi:uncharacterized membrane protein